MTKQLQWSLQCILGKKHRWRQDTKNKVIGAPNKGTTVDLNTQISASGTNVYVT